MSKSSAAPIQPFFKSRGYVPGGIVTNSKNETLHMEALPPFLRTLLVTDGTVTKHLEAFFWEQVEVENLGQAEATLAHDVPWLEMHAGDSVLRRYVRLHGAESGRVYAHAESLIRLTSLPEKLRVDLLHGRIGIGELLREKGLETYREILDVGKREDAGKQGEQRVYRTYRIVINHHPAILITEEFPCDLYRS
jgi:chorismate-pyruvate lyase